MAGFHRHADLAVGLEAADSRPVTGTRIDHHERTALVINLHATWRSNAHQRVVDRSLKRSAVDDQFNRIVEDMRRGFGDMFAVLQSALAHDIEEQDAALPGIHQIFEGGCKEPGQRIARDSRLVGRHAQISHCLQPMHQDCAPADGTIDIGQGRTSVGCAVAFSRRIRHAANRRIAGRTLRLSARLRLRVFRVPCFDIRRGCLGPLFADPCHHQFPGHRQDDGPDKQAEDAMRQHAAQDTDEDDKHRRVQPAPHEHRLQDIVGEPHDQQVDRQRKRHGEILGRPNPYDDGNKDDRRPDLQDRKNQHERKPARPHEARPQASIRFRPAAIEGRPRR
mgnify:CR=1 FL=1